MLPNRYPGDCGTCRRRVPVGAGAVERSGPTWITRCADHAREKAPAADSKPTVTVACAGSSVSIKPAGYLGGDTFGAYRTATNGAKYDPVTRTQVCTWDALPPVLDALRAAGFALQVSPDVAARLQARKATIAAARTAAGTRAAAVDAVLAERGLSLFPFQRVGIDWLAQRDAALLADEMGLGKTIQALVAAPAGAPVLVVCPAVAKGVWAREAARWRPDLRVSLLSGRGSFRWPTAGEMVVVNYDILPSTGVDAAPAGTVMICDEAHAVKNRKALRTERVRALSAAARAAGGKVWLLTATPLLGKPPELWGVLSAAGLEAETFGSWKAFVALFDGERDSWGGVSWGTPSPAVADRLQRTMLRRLKADCTDLPPKRHAFHTVEVDAKAAAQLDKIAAQAAKALGCSSVASMLANLPPGLPAFEGMSRARALLAGLKTEAAVALVEQYEDQEEPIVVFSAHRAPIDLIGARDGWAAITGDTSPEERRQIEDAFQAGKLRGVAATIQAGGVAITLTRATNAIFVDRDWTPALNAQAEDRIHRIGTTGSVLITVLVANHALDERMTDVLGVKQAIITGSTDAATRGATEAPKVAQAEVSDDELHAVAAVAVAAAQAEAAAPYRAPRSFVEAVTQQALPPAPARHKAATAQERWAEQALLALSGMDEDRAREQNGVGWNKMDGSFGHQLADQVADGLTEKQWNAAIKMCSKYHRQIGRCPK